ncbi:MAG: alanine racemase [Burkholderiales bacterium]|nr:alanine racemase [Burkholderiales bacterium]
MRPVRAEIDLAALRANLGLARRLGAGARVWAVVKANAYGHGLSRVVPALAAADGLALIEIGDAVALREAGYARPILLLEGFFEAAELRLFSSHAFTAVVHSAEQLAMLEGAALERPIDVCVKVNTGMNRLGFRAAAAAGAIARLRASAGVASITLMTHFADADGERGIAAQLASFDTVASAAGLPQCTANSAALIRYPQSRRDWVRPGIMLYGCSPLPDRPAEAIGLAPVMTLSSRIIAVQELAPGERLGYGGTFGAEQPMRIGIVACGYADGYPRHAPAGTPILVGARRTRIVGLPSMDMLYADLSGLPEAGPGTAVTLWGRGLSADEVARAAGTVSYELLCSLNARVPVAVTGAA